MSSDSDDSKNTPRHSSGNDPVEPSPFFAPLPPFSSFYSTCSTPLASVT